MKQVALILSALLQMSVVCAQNMFVRQMPGSDQLPSGEVMAVMQDDEGYMWYGTPDGLCRDDGYDIKVFRSDYNTPGFMERNSVNYIADGGDGNIWYSTGKGIYIFNKQTFSNHVLGVDDLSDTFYSLIVRTADSCVWVGGSSMLYRMTSSGKVLSRYKLKAGVSCFCTDREDNLFFSVFGDGLYCVPSGTDKVVTVCRGYVPTCMCEDIVNGGYWTCETGLRHMTYDVRKPKVAPQFELMPIPKDSAGHDVTFFTRIVQDRHEHRLWLLSYYRGIILLDKSGRQEDLPDCLKEINSNTMNFLYEDRQGDLWFTGYDTGCNILSWDRHDIKDYSLKQLDVNSLSRPSVECFVKDKGGVLWIYQHRSGLYLYDPATSHTSFYYHYPALHLLPLYQIIDIALCPDGKTVWVAYYGNRLVRLHRNGMDFVLDELIDLSALGHSEIYINSVNPSPDGKALWLATTTGLFRLKTNARQPKLDCLIDKGDVSAVVCRENHTDVWCSLRGEGLRKITAKGDVHVVLPAGQSQAEAESVEEAADIRTFDIDSRGIVWLATGDARVLAFNPESQTLKDYTTSCGMGGDAITDLIVDNQDHVWTVSNRQIREFSPQNGRMRGISLHANHRMLQQILPHSVFHDRQAQTVMVGGIPSIISLKPFSQSDSTQSRLICITDVTVSNHSVWFDSARHPEKSQLCFSPDERNIEIHFSALDILNADGLRYAYRLLGLHDEWVYTSNGGNVATYSNLPKGKYRFQVKVVDDNLTSDDGITEIVIERQPAWYESDFAYLVYVIICLLLIWKAIRQYKLHLRQKSMHASVVTLPVASQQFLDKATEIVTTNMSNEAFNVDFLASELCMSRSTLARKLRTVTEDTPLEFIRSIRMKHAYQLLQQHDHTVTEVAESVGYADRNTFTRAFKDTFGIPPSKV